MSDFRQEPIELICRPVLKHALCRFGEKCFHDIHYLCEADLNGTDCIPEDACPFEALVSNLRIDEVERAGNCVRVRGRYDISVFFRFDDQRRVGTASRDDVEFLVQVPLQNLNGGCQDIVCESGPLEREVCAFNTRLEIIEAAVERDGIGTGDVCEGCDFRIRVVVEKVFRAFEHGLQVLCIPVCPPEACVPPTVPPTTEAPFCPPFTRPTECPSFCVDDEHFFPDNCNQCPPPQVTVPPTTVSPTPPVTTQPPTTQPPTTQPPTTQPPTTQPPTTQPPTTQPPTTQPPTTPPPCCRAGGTATIVPGQDPERNVLIAANINQSTSFEDLFVSDTTGAEPQSLTSTAITRIECSPGFARVEGSGLILRGGVSTNTTYTAEFFDNGDPGAGVDRFRITTANGELQVDAIITTGNLVAGFC